MPDLQHVGPGDPLAIRSETWNLLLDAARDKLDTRLGKDKNAPYPYGLTPALMAVGQNAMGSGSNSQLSPLNVVTPQAPVIDPNVGDPLVVRRRPMLTVAAPQTANDVVFIVFDAMPNGETGRVIVGGVTVASVNVISLSHKFAQPVPGVTNYLQTATSGPVRLLYAASILGQQNLLVLIDNQVCCSPDVCTPCPNATIANTLYVGNASGCGVNPCNGNLPLSISYQGTQSNSWIGIATCSGLSGSNCVCLESVTLRCVNNNFVVDVTRADSNGHTVTHNDLSVTIASCNPFCATFIVPADSICTTPTTYNVSDNSSFTNCGSSGSGSGSGSGGGSCCHDENQRTGVISNLTTSCGSGCFTNGQVITFVPDAVDEWFSGSLPNWNGTCRLQLNCGGLPLWRLIKSNETFCDSSNTCAGGTFAASLVSAQCSPFLVVWACTFTDLNGCVYSFTLTIS